MVRLVNLDKRGALAIGQRVRVNQRYRSAYRKSNVTHGVVQRFLPGTEVRVQFDGRRWSQQVDERFLEPVNG